MALADAISITLDDVKRYLKLDEEDTDEDNELIMMIDAAIDRADRYINKDWNSSDIVPEGIRLACMAMISSWYEHRDDSTSETDLGDYRVKLSKEIPGDMCDRLMVYRILPGV